MEHGKRSTYIDHKCRCRPCRDANAAYQREANLNRKAKGLAADDPRHGTWSTYTNWMCRCDRCKAVGSLVNKAAADERKAKAS